MTCTNKNTFAEIQAEAAMITPVEREAFTQERMPKLEFMRNLEV